jgi:hypothetical protein
MVYDKCLEFIGEIGRNKEFVGADVCGYFPYVCVVQDVCIIIENGCITNERLSMKHSNLKKQRQISSSKSFTSD